MIEWPVIFFSDRTGVHVWKGGTCETVHSEGYNYYGVSWSEDSIFFSTPKKIYKKSKEGLVCREVSGCNDFHQILYSDNIVYGTITNTNELCLLDGESLDVVDRLDLSSFGNHHLNSVYFYNNEIYVCFHNDGPSEIIKISSDGREIERFLGVGSKNHNIYIEDGMLYTINSAFGRFCMYDLKRKKEVKSSMLAVPGYSSHKFGRGLGRFGDYFIVGANDMGSREDRECGLSHFVMFDRDLNVVDCRKTNVRSQVKDLRIVSEIDLAHNNVAFPWSVLR